MSFIAITYGYNQFSIFNTNVSTYPLIDNIISICLDEISNSLQVRLSTLTKEIDLYSQDEESLKKIVKQQEQNKQKEEEKLIEAQKVIEQANNPKDNKDPKKQIVKQTNPPNLKNQKIELNSPLNLIMEEIKSTDTKLQVLIINKEKSILKKKTLIEILEKQKTFDKNNLKIELVDVNGDRMNLLQRGDIYANQFLLDRQVYELNRLILNEKNELTPEPFKFDGFCMRTVEDDIKWEEYEKTNKNSKKPNTKKK